MGFGIKLLQIYTDKTKMGNRKENALSPRDTKPQKVWWERVCCLFSIKTILGRLLLSTSLLVIITLTIATYSQARFTASSDISTTRLRAQINTNHQIVNLRNLLWKIETQFQSYMLQPEDDLRLGVLETVEHSIIQLSTFRLTPWIQKNQTATQTVSSFQDKLGKLRIALEDIMLVRADPLKVFPIMPIMVNYLNPTNQRMNNQINLALLESEEMYDEPEQKKVRATLNELRYVWSQKINTFRMLISTRVGIFQGTVADSIHSTTTDIEIYDSRLKDLIAELQNYDEQGVLGLQQSASLDELASLNQQWNDHYIQARAIITQNDAWRTDTPVLRDEITPLFLSLWAELENIDKILLERAKQDLEITKSISEQVSSSLWILAIAILAISLFSTLMFELQVRRPLIRISNALHEEAKGNDHVPLPESPVTETRQLIDAFSHMREQVFSRQEHLQAVLAYAAEAIVTFDESGRIENWNHAAEQLFGWEEKEVIGCIVSQFISSDWIQLGTAHINKPEIEKYIGHETEVIGQHKNGTCFPMSLKIGKMTLAGKQKYTALLANIAERKAMMENLRHMAEHDSLTGLYNRAYFHDQLDEAVSLARLKNESLALLYIDLDNFKYVNDTLGHLAGDKLLIEVSELLNMRARRSDLVARLGGDEFVLIIHDVNRDSAQPIADSYRKMLVDYQFNFEGKTVDVGCSIGVAMIDKEENSPAEVLSKADVACHLAKRAGRNRVHIFTPKDEGDVTTMTMDMGWSRRIRQALEHDRFVLAAQPIYKTQNKEIYSHEILVRMLDEDGTIIMPSGFLPTAERFGLSVEVDLWIIRQAITQLALLHDCGHKMDFSINLSGQSMSVPIIAETIHELLDKTQLAPSSLIFEVTETVAITEMDKAVNLLNNLREQGCQTALDDFGSGMSSFAYLQELPVDIVKIDGRFVRNIANNTVDQAVVKAMHDIAHALGKRTVAEFVEHESHFKELQKIGVDYCQGFHLGKPKLLDQITEPLMGKNQQPRRA